MIRQTPSQESNEVLLKRLRAQPVVVLSPHFDDACLSLGGLLLALGGGTLINVFTRSRYLVNSDIAEPSEDHVHATRDAEDRAFAARCGLERIDLRCASPGLKHRSARDLTGLEEDIAQASALIVEELDRLAGAAGRAFLFCPMGIGVHVNHRATTEIVLRNLARIRKSYDVCLYEDLPYAANLVRRISALARIKRRLGGLERYVFVPSWETKRRLVELYPSQFQHFPALRDLSPAALSPRGLHEAFWAEAD